jgi:hypothetical protein
MSGGVSESLLLLELLELLLELLLESSSPGSLGGAVVGNGWSSAAEFLAGLGGSGVAAGLLGSPGKGNCSETEGLVALAAGGVHGLGAVCGDDWFWFGAGHGASGGAWGALV